MTFDQCLLRITTAVSAAALGDPKSLEEVARDLAEGDAAWETLHNGGYGDDSDSLLDLANLVVLERIGTK